MRSPGGRLALGGVLALGLCCTPEARGRSTPHVTDVTAEDYEAPPLPRGEVLLRDAFGGAHRVEVEVAATEPARTRGLMWRTSLPPGRGMLFVFPEEEVHGFWMRNTLIPLDMIFIDRERRIVGIVERAEPRSLRSRRVAGKSLYVLEVPGGWSQERGIRVGSIVELRGVPDPAAAGAGQR